MLVYNYDPITKEYLSNEEAGRNPLNEDEPLIPANATTIRPPKSVKGKAIIWIGNKWEYKEDHRNEIWYNANTKTNITIDFIGTLPDYFYPLDSVIANKPDGDYWEYDENTNTWVGNAVLYKQYILSNFKTYWGIKQSTPFLFEEHKYLPLWRDLYDSIYNTLNNGIKTEYRLQDFDSKYIIVNKKTMKPIYTKMANIVDEMYTDKQDLETYFKKENDFSKLEKMFTKWVNKQYN